MQLVDRANISVEVAENLRQMIADGILVAGSRINEVHLARELGVSRTPLREALAMLLAEGALENKPRRGFFVCPLTQEEFLNIYTVRPLLDVGALRMAGLPSAEVIASLREINDRLDTAHDAIERIRIDDEWHLLLVGGCDNPVLLNLIEQFILRTRRYELAYLRERSNSQTAVAEHRAIMDALENESLQEACEALNRNLSSGVAPILEWLQERSE